VNLVERGDVGGTSLAKLDSDTKEAGMITLSHGGPTMYRSPVASRQLLVGTIEGLVCLERQTGGGWRVARRTLTTDNHLALATWLPTAPARAPHLQGAS